MINGNKIGLVTTDTCLWLGVYRATEPGIRRVEDRRRAKRRRHHIRPSSWRETMRLARLAADRYSRSPRRTWRAGTASIAPSRPQG